MHLMAPSSSYPSLAISLNLSLYAPLLLMLLKVPSCIFHHDFPSPISQIFLLLQAPSHFFHPAFLVPIISSALALPKFSCSSRLPNTPFILLSLLLLYPQLLLSLNSLVPPGSLTLLSSCFPCSYILSSCSP